MPEASPPIDPAFAAIPSRRRRALQRVFDEVVIEFMLWVEQTHPPAKRWGQHQIDQWERWLLWHAQQWMRAGDTDPASIKQKARAALHMPSRLHLKPLSAKPFYDYTARLAAFETDHGKPFGQ